MDILHDYLMLISSPVACKKPVTTYLIIYISVLICRITCNAMVFRVTEDGVIKADTLCKFVESPSGATRLVGEKHQVRIFVTFLMHFKYNFFLDDSGIIA